MPDHHHRLTLAAAGLASILSVVAITKTASVTDVGLSRADLPAAMKEALAKDPGILMDAFKKMREKQAREGQKDIKAALEKYKGELFDVNSAPAIGNLKDADVTIVEFFDYHCGYCKKMLPTLAQLVKDDNKVRVIFREFPILSEDSTQASRAALAFSRLNKDKYFEYHSALMMAQGKFDEKLLSDTAQKFGVSAAKLKPEMEKPEISAALAKNREIGDALGVRGTPALLIGNQLLPGAVGYDDLKKLVADTRAGKK